MINTTPARHRKGRSPITALVLGLGLMVATGYAAQNTDPQAMKLAQPASEILSDKQQAIPLIACFMAASDMPKLNAALNQGLDAGLTVSEVKEVLVQLYAYVGFPRSLNALGELLKVVEARKQRGIQDPPGREPTRAIPTGDQLLAVGTANQTASRAHRSRVQCSGSRRSSTSSCRPTCSATSSNATTSTGKAFEQGDFRAAKAMYEDSLAIGRQLRDQLGIALSLHHLGDVSYEQGDYRAAGELYKDSLAIWRELRDKRGIACELEGLASVVAALGCFHRAARIWGAVEQLIEETSWAQSPTDHRYTQRVAAARASLDDDAAFDRAWQDGCALTLEQAINVALEETTVERP